MLSSTGGAARWRPTNRGTDGTTGRRPHRHPRTVWPCRSQRNSQEVGAAVRILPAIAAVVTAAMVIVKLLEGDWGMVLLGVLLCAVSVRAFVLLGRKPDP